MTDGNGNLAANGTQEYDPWGNIAQTTLNYTGQRRDGTGLLFYNARYYDPAVGRFLSADTVVPGNASGGMDGVALRPLTVDFHEGGLVSGLNGEGAYGDRLDWSGPADPQALNRYAYVRNNPVNATDPSGHVIPCQYKGCRSPGADMSGWPDAAKAAMKFVCFFVGCEVDEESQMVKGSLESDLILGSVPVGNVRFSSGKLLNEHFKKHAAEFGYKSAKEYLEGASKLVSESGVLSFRRNNGDTLFYDHIANSFATVDRFGNITTYFKPIEGMEYWLEQLRKP